MILKLAWRNIWRNKRRSLITIASIMVAIFLAIFMRSIQLGMYANMIRNVVGNYSGYVQVHAKGYWAEQSLNNGFEVDDDLTSKILAVKGVTNIVPRLSNFALASAKDLTKGLNITGMDAQKEAFMKPIEDRLISGHVFRKENEVVIGKKVAGYFKTSLGDTLVFIGQGYHGSNAAGKFVISGVIDMKNPLLNQSTVLMDLKAFQNYLDAPNVVTNLVILKNEYTNETQLAHRLAQALDSNSYEVMDWHEMQPEIDQTIQVDSIGGLIMIAILYMIITFGIFGTVLMMVQERMYELGIMVSIGMKKLKLAAIIFLETILLSLMGVILGMIAVSPVVYYYHINPIDLSNAGSKGIESFGFEPIIPALLDPSIYSTHGLIVLGIAMLIGFYPIWIILRLNPIKAMRA